jgi:predicted DNA-binding protein with PD1-like motif
MSPTQPLLEPVRLPPGTDLRVGLQAALAARGARAAFVVAGIGSLRPARLRLAGADAEHAVEGDSEILTLSGTLSPDGPHLHIGVSDAQGHVVGGHVLPGCTVRTTAELLVAWLDGWAFAREHDPATGYAELAARRIS